jgi:hypothetical protein
MPAVLRRSTRPARIPAAPVGTPVAIAAAVVTLTLTPVSISVTVPGLAVPERAGALRLRRSTLTLTGLPLTALTLIVRGHRTQRAPQLFRGPLKAPQLLAKILDVPLVGRLLPVRFLEDFQHLIHFVDGLAER